MKTYVLIFILSVMGVLACKRSFEPVGSPEQIINLALGKMAVASSTEDSSFVAMNAVDGNDGSFWSSSNSNYKQWLYVDLAGTYAVDSVVVKWVDGKYATALDIEVSSDAVLWSTIFTTNTNAEAEVNFIGGLSGLGKYVRVQGRGRGGGDRYRIAELEVFGSAEQPNTPAQQAGIDTVSNRLVQSYLAGTVDESQVGEYASSMMADGSWADVDYESVTLSFPAGTHLNRLKAMAMAFKKPGNSYYQSSQLLNQIVLGLDFYRTKQPASSNWWYNDIGGPQDYMISVLLLKGSIPQMDLIRLSSYLRDQIARFAGGGKNLTWIAAITMHKGCIEDSFRLVDAAFTATFSPLEIVTKQGDEGIKSDFSFHQHHAQLYSGGYGLSIIGDFTSSLEIAAGTVFTQSISPMQRQLLTSFLLEGTQLFGYRNTFDFGTLGRNISRASGSYTNLSATVLDQMLVADPANASTWQAWKTHLSGGTFPSTYQGNKHFWKSDIMTQHGANYYLSAKIISSRTYGTEALNGENTKGFNLPMGATNILTNGLEYTGIYPAWDWTRIPGTTGEHNQAATVLDGYQIGTNDFGGGVSNGQDGIIAFNGTYNEVAMRKSYFFLNGNMCCVGSGIVATKSNPIYTSVNQCLLNGIVTLNSGTNVTSTFGGSQTFSDLHWAHHDNVGYLFFTANNATVQARPQTGSWNMINIDGASTSITKDVFSLWVDHGNNPNNAKYAYLIVPDQTLGNFQAWVPNHGYSLIRNDVGLQAVGYLPEGIYAAVFYHSGSLDLEDGWSISVDGAVMLLLKKNGSSVEISVADPLYNSSARKLTINQQLTGPGASYQNGVTEINFSFPTTDDEIGKSVKATFALNSF